MVRVQGAALVLVMCLTAASARAQTTAPLDEDPNDVEASRKAPEREAGFGPEVTVEAIEVVGNSRTAERLIRRAVLVKEGDVLRQGDPRFRTSRFRVLALGYFADVQLKLRRGTARGMVILTVDVAERKTLILSRLFFGASEATPWWLGIDGGDGNFLGTGIGLSAAVVHAAAADMPGADDQLALRFRYSDPSVLGLPLGAHATFLYNDASEPVGWDAAPGVRDWAAYSYRRIGGAGGVSLELTRLTSIIADARVEAVDVVSAASVVAVGLEAGRSWVNTVALGFERDTRADPVLPYGGDRALLGVEYGDTWLGGDYQYVTLRSRYERWFPLAGFRHVLSLHLGAAVILGDAPQFDRLYIGDWDRLLPPRPLDLVVSTRTAPDLLGVAADSPRYGDVAGSLEVEYSHRLFRKRSAIYGGDLFFGAGVFAFGSRRDVAGDVAGGRAVGLTFDIGLRLDTEIGVFELGLSNALGRIPL